MNPVVHFEIRSDNPDEARPFYGELFGWTFSEGGIPGYTYVDSGVPNTIPGGIGPTQGGNALTTFFGRRRERARRACRRGTARWARRPARHERAGRDPRPLRRPAGTGGRGRSG